MTWSPWARAYAQTPNTYIWGTKPSKFAREVSAHLRPGARVLDLGCGEGRDSVFFATCGFEVVGVDVSAAGLQKAERLAHAHGVKIGWVDADATRWVPRGLFDLVYSCGALHYVARRQRARVISQLQAATRAGGHHALAVFTDRHIYIEHGERIDYFGDGELRRAYADWLILRNERALITCRRNGIAHRHGVQWFLATKAEVDRRPTNGS
ncbi:MAG: class I SAM-dependent methyltransferase [Candidatus Rokuibacteriota bacterium]